MAKIKCLFNVILYLSVIFMWRSSNAFYLNASCVFVYARGMFIEMNIKCLKYFLYMYIWNQ